MNQKEMKEIKSELGKKLAERRSEEIVKLRKENRELRSVMVSMKHDLFIGAKESLKYDRVIEDKDRRIAELEKERAHEIRGLQEDNQHQAEHICQLQNDLEYALIVCDIYMSFFGGSDLEDQHEGIMLLDGKRTAIRYIEKLLKYRPGLISSDGK